MKILAFGASSSTQSINKQLAFYAAKQIAGAEIKLIDLNDFELPMYSVDRERQLGKPTLAQSFLDLISQADAIVISFAEHNGSYSVAYKNLFDWCSRINSKLFQNKPMLMLATSPGARGGASVLATAVASAAYFDGDVKASVSLPSFYDNFDEADQEVTNPELRAQIQKAADTLIAAHV